MSAEERNSLISTLKQFEKTYGHKMTELIDAVTGCHKRPSGGTECAGEDLEVYKKAISDSREELLLRYTTGTGVFDENMSFNHLSMDMFTLDGCRDGDHDGVWQPLVDPSEFYSQPKRSKGPVDAPKGPIGLFTIRAWTNARWRFGADKKDAVYAEGPANLHLVPLADGSQMFLVSVAAIITGGDGTYAGARGVKTAIGSTFVEKGKNLTDFHPPAKFEAVTVETFRIICGDSIGKGS